VRLVEDGFIEATARSGPSLAEATLLVYDPGGISVIEEIDLPILDGSVNLSWSSATYASLSLDIAVDDLTASELVADDGSDKLAPYGNEIRIRKGVQLASGAESWADLGIFRIDRTTMSDSGGELSISIDGLDRSAAIIEAGFEQAFTIASATGCGTAILSILAFEVDSGKFSYNASDFTKADEVTLPLLGFEAGDDRWDACQAIAEAASGSRLYFDGTGTLRLTSPVPSALPLLEIAEGSDGVLLSASKDFSREGGYNRVEVRGESSGNDPAYGEWEDTDPNSPTRYGGKFGRLTYRYSSEYITDDDQADVVAQTIGEQKKGTSQSISFTSLANPALEPGDTVRIRRERLKIDEDHIIDELTIPLGLEDMSGSTRVMRVTS